MSGKGGRIGGWLVALALGLGAGYLVFSNRDESIVQAVDKGQVTVDIRANDETSATFTVKRLDGAPGKLTLAIPAGTPIQNSDPDGQWLITARQMVIQLSDENPQVTEQIETYCAHQFAKPPDSTSQLGLATTAPSYSPGGSAVVEQEVEPLHELTDCLAGQSVSRGDRQLAVWMIADGWAARNYENVREALGVEYRKRAQAETPAEMEAELRSQLREKHPKLSEELLRTEVEDYMRTRLDQRIAQKADEEVAKELDGFIHSAKPALESCGSKPGEMKFFQTAP